MSRSAFRVSLFSLAIALLPVLMPVPPAHAETAGQSGAVETGGATGVAPWPLILLLAAFALTAFVGRGRNRGEA